MHCLPLVVSYLLDMYLQVSIKCSLSNEDLASRIVEDNKWVIRRRSIWIMERQYNEQKKNEKKTMIYITLQGKYWALRILLETMDEQWCSRRVRNIYSIKYICTTKVKIYPFHASTIVSVLVYLCISNGTSSIRLRQIFLIIQKFIILFCMSCCLLKCSYFIYI